MKKLLFIISWLSLTPVSAQEAQDTLESFTEGKEDTTTVKILRLHVNSAQPDFSPFFSGNELFFVSGRNRDLGVDYVDANGESEITDLYCCTLQKPGRFRNTRLLDSRLNSRYYEGPFCVNQAGTVIYFTANDRRSSLLKIYRSEKQNGQWSRPEQLSFCKDNFSYFHPALSPDEQTLVFSTDRNKEKNRIDLYLSKLNGEDWSAPRPLNALINDTNSQVFPFISRDNTLYFSCDKKKGTGMDIYFVSLDSAEKVPRPMAFPINTAFDDFGIWIDSTMTSGYFSTNRVKKFKDDIYYFTNTMPDFKESHTVVPKAQFCYSFVEESTSATNDTLNLSYEWDFGDGKKSRGLRTRHCYKAPGDYLVVLNVVDKATGEIVVNKTSYPLTIEKPNQLLIEANSIALANEELVLTAKEPYLKNCKLEKICWAFGDGRFNSGSSVKHTYKNPGTYTVLLGVVTKNKDTNKTELYKVEKEIVVKAAIKKNTN